MNPVNCSCSTAQIIIVLNRPIPYLKSVKGHDVHPPKDDVKVEQLHSLSGRKIVHPNDSLSESSK